MNDAVMNNNFDIDSIRSNLNETIEVIVLVVAKNNFEKIKKSITPFKVTDYDFRTVIPSQEEGCLLVRLDANKFDNEEFGTQAVPIIVYTCSNYIYKKQLVLGYHQLSYDQVLHKLLPKDIVVPRAFETTGHIAHFNLDDSQYPYRKIIGEVLMDKISNIRSVVCKIGNIDTVYRTFKMELIAGEDDMIVNLNINNCRFEFDYSKVYWNSRLNDEHKRLVDLFNPGSCVVDIFAGVGPFAVPAGKKGVRIYANDLNPDSFKWLQHNIQLNKVDKLISSFNLDAIDFIKKIKDSDRPIVDHIIMNLPASSIDFVPDVLKVFDYCNPIIHCYYFIHSDGNWFDEAEKTIKKIVPNITYLNMFDVRTVSATSHMIRISFKYN